MDMENEPKPVAKPAPPKAKPAPAKPVPIAQAAPLPAAPRPAPAKPAMGSAVEEAPAPDDVHQDEHDEPSHGSGRFLMFQAVPSWAISMLVHTIAVIVMALIPMPETATNDRPELVVAKPDPDEEAVEEFEIEEIQEIDLAETVADVSADIAVLQTVTQEVTQVTMANDIDAAAISIELSDFGEQTAPRNDLLATIGSVTGSGVEGRGAGMRGDMVRKGGGNDATEAAVAAALKWFANHQSADGGWNFDHRAGGNIAERGLGPCNGQCDHAGGATQARNAATAMALLPFLGAGNTHREGAYKKQVAAGLTYLLQHMKLESAGGSFHEAEGNMYSHGLATIVLTEAYAMTHDKELLGPAQAAVNFICNAQDPVQGGWGYSPRSSGDTSVVGWQLMALKSGHMGYLHVNPDTVRMAVRFLDSVSDDSGAFYGYRTPGRGPATTACGLLSRMYLGWKRENPALQRGVEWISAQGVSKGNMYYNYYATQVMRQHEGEEWDKWNTQMKEWLPGAQEKTGHLAGSWHMSGDHGSERGGRIYCTSMATMMLEVYYRHMPIYGKEASDEDFPL